MASYTTANNNNLFCQEIWRLEYQVEALWEYEGALLNSIFRQQKRSLKVLDLGCGPGFFAAKVASINDNIHVTGIDPNERFVSFAQKYNMKKNINFIKGKDSEIPGNERYDILYMRFLCQHIRHHDAFFNNLRRVLADNALCIVFDTDLDKHTISPEPREYSYLKTKLSEIQMARGGNPNSINIVSQYMSSFLRKLKKTKYHLSSNKYKAQKLLEMSLFPRLYQTRGNELIEYEDLYNSVVSQVRNSQHFVSQEFCATVGSYS